jgi:hypothetical protein
MPKPELRLKQQLLAEITGNDWSAADVCQQLEISDRQLSNYQRAGLPYRIVRRSRRFDPEEVRAFLRGIWGKSHPRPQHPGRKPHTPPR